MTYSFWFGISLGLAAGAFLTWLVSVLFSNSSLQDYHKLAEESVQLQRQSLQLLYEILQASDETNNVLRLFLQRSKPPQPDNTRSRQ